MTPRPATCADTPALGVMHVAAWRETYRGLVPDTVLDTLDPAARTARWQAALARGERIWMAEDAQGIAGFGAWGPRRDPALPCPNEIGALYVLRRAQRQGLGRALMAAMAAEMAGGVALWVLDTNLPARDFYAALGGRPAARRTSPRDGWVLEETAYAWADAASLASPARTA